MEFEDEKAEALQILRGIEQGTMSPAESHELLEKADPTLVYFIFRWMKKHYHKDHEHYEVMRERLRDITARYRSLTRKARTGEDDPVVEWFEGTHLYRELGAEEFIDIIVEKLEG